MVLELDVNALRRVILPRVEIRDFLDEIREVFAQVGSGGYRFPVCSCPDAPGNHDKGRIYINTPGVRHRSWSVVSVEA